jgi:HTH-type transcriptional regulator, sugar sensing transcriptional regulator
MLIKELKTIGLTEKEAQVYLAALELGETNINRLAEKSKVKRTTVYLAVDALKQKGLISEVKRNRKTWFLAEDPRIMETILSERKNLLAKIMPELLSFDNLLDKKPGIQYYEGDEGIKTAYKQTLNYPGTEIAAIYSNDFMTDFDESFFRDYYIPQRIKNKNLARTLFPDTPVMRGWAANDQKHLRLSKFLPSDKFIIKVEMSTFGNRKTLLVSYKEKFAIIIESKLIHDSFKGIFETMWMFASE